MLGRRVRPSELFAAILSDPDAALLAHGLSALDDETLQFLAAHPSLLTTLYRKHATVFATFAAHLRIRNGRVATPGGDAAGPLWEALLGARATDPAAFVTALFAQAEGRFAYLYDVIGHLDTAHAAFALGLWLPDHVVRVDRFQALARAVSSTIGEWNATSRAVRATGGGLADAPAARAGRSIRHAALPGVAAAVDGGARRAHRRTPDIAW